MILSRIVFISFLLLLFASRSAFSEGMTFALVAKSINDGNFTDVWKGCDEAAKQSKDKCVLLGGSGDAHPRLQEIAIKEALKTNHFDAFAVSVVSSKFVARALQHVNVPVITFDSPFDEEYAPLSRAYVGVDNSEFGGDLARMTKQLLPDGGTICFMYAMHDQNMSLRILGARRELSGDSEFPKGKRLEGEGGWTEAGRCPWNSADNLVRSLTQLKYSLKIIKPDVFISLGHWPVIDVPAYMNTTEPFYEEISQKKQLIFIGIGTQSMSTMETLINDGLAHGYASIDFPEIGRRSYEVMKRIVEGEKIEQLNYVPNIIRLGN